MIRSPHWIAGLERAFPVRNRRWAFQLSWLLGGALWGTQGAAAQAPYEAVPGLAAKMDKWYKTATRRAPGKWGIAVADAQGRLLWGVEPTRPLIPASTVKLLTTGYARSVLGSDARKTTRVLGTGKLNEKTGVWEGSWALEINGDPTLEHRSDQGMTSLNGLAQELAKRGVKILVGPLALTSARGQPKATFPLTWSVRHMGRRFAPLVGNLTIHDNVIGAVIAPGAKVGAPLRLVSTSPAGAERLFLIKAKTVKGRRSRISVEATADGRYIVKGKLGIRSRYRSVLRASSDPKAVLAAVWATALENAGITWRQNAGGLGGPDTGRTVLAEIHSPVFDSIASEVNRRSFNLGAELMLRWATNDDPAGADSLTAHVRGVTGDYRGVNLVDGSGLSDYNRVSPMTFVSYLARFPMEPAGRNFPMLLPQNGTGTLTRLRNGLPQQGVVRAKTGTLGNVASVVGYLGTTDGVLLVSIIYNGSRIHAARAAQWELFRTLGANGIVIPSDTSTVESETEQLGGEDQ